MSGDLAAANPPAIVPEAVCGARTRQGGWCKRSPTAGKRRCHNHGGAPGTGAPRGNRNARKHGAYCREVKQLQADAAAMCRRLARTIALVKAARRR